MTKYTNWIHHWIRINLFPNKIIYNTIIMQKNTPHNMKVKLVLVKLLFRFNVINRVMKRNTW